MSRHIFSLEVGEAIEQNIVQYNNNLYLVTTPGTLIEIDPSSETFTQLYTSAGQASTMEIVNGVAYWMATNFGGVTLFAYDIDAGSEVYALAVNPYSGVITIDETNGLLYHGDHDGSTVTTFNERNISDGSENWSVQINSNGNEQPISDILLDGGFAYFGTSDGTMYKIDLAAQSIDSSFDTGLGNVRGGPYMYRPSGGDEILFGQRGEGVYSLNPTDMSLNWGPVTPGAISGVRSKIVPDMASPDGTENVWVGGLDGFVLMDPSDQTAVYSIEALAAVFYIGPIINYNENGQVGYTGISGNFLKTDSRTTDATEWQFTDSGNLASPMSFPLKDGNVIYFGDTGGTFYAINDILQQVSGTVTDSGGNPVEGAIITVIDETDDAVVGTTTTAADGTYSITAAVNNTVHVLCEYTDANGDQHSLSYPFVTPVVP